MNRRELLKNIGIALPAVALTPATAMLEKSPTISSNEIRLLGWHCRWSGWRELPNMDVKVGFWIAYNLGSPSDWHFYASYPGAEGEILPRQMFDMSWRDGQTPPSLVATEKELDSYKSECFSRLKRLIVENGPPPLKRRVRY